MYVVPEVKLNDVVKSHTFVVTDVVVPSSLHVTVYLLAFGTLSQVNVPASLTAKFVGVAKVSEI